MKILGVGRGSPAESAGVVVGDRLSAINGERVRDVLDYAYWSHDQDLALLVGRNGTYRTVQIPNRGQVDIGLAVEPPRTRRCRNNCIFCFIDQLPPGLRDSLYLKDEDYRLSFLHGNYITLTGLADRDMRRIRRYRLSPLYVSVHATDPKLRARMLGTRANSDVMEKVASLARANIEMHCQIVLCPGVNDGAHLERSLEELCAFAPQVRSVAVVPVGLTQFRTGLEPLQRVTPSLARGYVESWPGWQARFHKKLGTRWAYLADEFYLLAGADLPSAQAYEGFHQQENGVGMARSFTDAFARGRKMLPKRLAEPLSILLVTGVLASPLITDIAEGLSATENMRVDTVVVRNKFLGDTITVSGLLTGSDMLDDLSKNRTAQQSDSVTILPPNCINQEGLFLDNVSLDDLRRALPTKVVLGTYDLAETLRGVLGGRSPQGVASSQSRSWRSGCGAGR